MSMKPDEAANSVVMMMRSLIAQCDGPEAEVLLAFSDIIGREVDGIDFRLAELEEVLK